MEKIGKAKINRIILKAFGRIGVVVFLLFFSLNITKVQGTNSFFTDKAEISNNKFSSGYWIPHLDMTVNPEDPDGKEGFYITTPCVKLSAEINGEKEGIEIYYEFSDDGDPLSGGTKYAGECVEIPDGNPTHFQAQAVNEENENWKSNLVAEDFKVRTGTKEGDVIINEIMWMGSFQSENDEWIELRNMTEEDINLKNWRIYGAAGGSGHLQIDGNTEDGYIIPAQGFFLISKYDKKKSAIDVTPDLVKGSLDLDDDYDDNGRVILEDANGNMIDETPAAKKKDWPKGLHGIFVPGGLMHLSMERDKDAKDWHTCNPLVMSHDQLKTMRDYWDEGIDRLFNCGTPGNANLSKNDPSEEDFDDFFAPAEETFSPAPAEGEVESVDASEEIVPSEETPTVEVPVETPTEIENPVMP